MTYIAATRYVEGLAILGMRFGLERMVRLLAALDDPHRAAPAIQIVGTNGKSSTARLAAACLSSQGARVGTYLSPHIVGWRERIEIDQRAIGKARFTDAIAAVRDAAAALDLAADEGVTQFEVLTAAAFAAFAAANLDAVVIEAGLGGRFDATNVMSTDSVIVLTNVALEHTELLGTTEAEIAAEKLAIAADGTDRLIIGQLSARAGRAVDDVMESRGLAGWRLGRDIHVTEGPRGVDITTPEAVYPGLPLPLRGAFQRDNLATAGAAAERRLGAPMRIGPLRRAVGRVRMPGRLEVIGEHPLMILDGAHNPAGIEAMAASLPQIVNGRRAVAVVSILGDKDAAAMVAPLADVCQTVVATRSSHPRAAAPDVIGHLAALAGMEVVVVEQPQEAIAHAIAHVGADGAVIVCGSLYLLADVRDALIAGG